MKRLTALFLAALLAFAPLAQADLRAANPGPVPRILSKSAIPFVSVSTGTMGNNGALTVGTALPRAYPNAFFCLPAGAVATSVPAATACLFTQCTTTTACTVFNNTYTTGTPTVPSSPTAFVTTGPGAYTGITTEVAGPDITIPANSLGANGGVRVHSAWSFTNSAGTKTFQIKLGGSAGTAFLNIGLSANTRFTHLVTIMNQGATNRQISFSPLGTNSFAADTGTITAVGTLDTTAAQNITFTITKTGATDNAAIEGYTEEILSDGT